MPARRTGDWDCPQCGDVAFASRTTCRRCYAPKPSPSSPGSPLRSSGGDEGGGGGGAAAGGDATGGASGGASGGGRPGDWTCPSCGDLVFASRSVCRMCATPKPSLGGPSEPTQNPLHSPSGQPGSPKQSRGRPGDWDCLNCGDLVFAFRDACRQCGVKKGEKGTGTAPKQPWYCPNCDFLLYASKDSCRTCGALRASGYSPDSVPFKDVPRPPKSEIAEVDFFIVLDFEATCEKDKTKQKPQEIIEFPGVAYDARTLQVVSQTQLYVKPVHRPLLSAFCTELTGISQEQVEAGLSFPDALKRFNEWLQPFLPRCVLVTVGDWDLQYLFPAQLELSGISGEQPDLAVFKRWIDIKVVFAQFIQDNRPPSGAAERGKEDITQQAFGWSLSRMLQFLRLEFQGRQHSGLDDCINTGNVLVRLINENACVWATKEGVV